MFVFCLWALIILNTFFQFLQNILEFYFANRIIFPWVKINIILTFIFQGFFCLCLNHLSIIFPHVVEKIRTEVCSTHTHVHIFWRRFSKQKTPSGSETENFCTCSVVKSSRRSCITLTRGIKIKRPLRDLYSDVKRNAFSCLFTEYHWILQTSWNPGSQLITNWGIPTPGETKSFP